MTNDNQDPFSAIGFQAALILNKLRNQREIKKHESEHDDQWTEEEAGEQQKAAQLISIVYKKLPIETGRVYRDTGGRLIQCWRT